jgi:hypothetical protein
MSRGSTRTGIYIHCASTARADVGGGEGGLGWSLCQEDSRHILLVPRCAIQKCQVERSYSESKVQACIVTQPASTDPSASPTQPPILLSAWRSSIWRRDRTQLNARALAPQCESKARALAEALRVQRQRVCACAQGRACHACATRRVRRRRREAEVCRAREAKAHGRRRRRVLQLQADPARVQRSAGWREGRERRALDWRCGGERELIARLRGCRPTAGHEFGLYRKQRVGRTTRRGSSLRTCPSPPAGSARA